MSFFMAVVTSKTQIWPMGNPAEKLLRVSVSLPRLAEPTTAKPLAQKISRRAVLENGVSLRDLFRFDCASTTDSSPALRCSTRGALCISAPKLDERGSRHTRPPRRDSETRWQKQR